MDERTAQELTESAAIAQQKGRHLDAAAMLHEALTHDQWNGGSWRALGRSWYELRQLRAAENAWHRAELLGSLDGPTARLREMALIASGRKAFSPEEVGARARSFNHGALPAIEHFVADAEFRLPVLFSLGEQNRFQAMLTIDDGPHPQTSRVILKTLKDHAVKAVFFLVGSSVEAYPEIVAEIVADGHYVASHGWRHERFPLLSPEEMVDEMDRTERALMQFRPTPKPYYFRLPGGDGWADQRVHAAIHGWNPDVVLVHWCVDSTDSMAPFEFLDKEARELDAELRVLHTLTDPAFSAPIILAHDNIVVLRTRDPAFYHQFYSRLIEETRRCGFEFVLP